ncbi:XdhC/CoxI family protein [Pseudodesulfovibrio sp. F-1]|uniref:XdhC/CoxI family protein n=1 Tax=Pseudodesulfovibrio alkaliphilus TaxID=2661613 RepID=A0A7K1KKZ3_9BACT|nr:XdhC/CoxI family protein [Pseudodesulfovibrio alkaliphilus]MUM76753.1 XdhC/CoxI family protein [Pseudodesulfovibrio alkaliphilus]
MKSLVRSVCELLARGETVVMATVVESSGSTPRSSGAKMIVRGDGSILGTVGGGLVEALACRDGLAQLDAGDGAARLLFVDLTNSLAAESDMICGGGLSVLLETVAPGGSCATAYAALDERIRRGVRTVLETRLEEADTLRTIHHAVLDAPAGNGIVFQRQDRAMRLMEPFTPPPSLYLFGAGHVSLFTARVGAMAGFRTVVLDDRADFANPGRFPEADQVAVLPSFDGCCQGLGIGGDDFVVIVTRGHLHDRTVLAEALRTPAGYIGMIGSKSKRDKIYASLLADGFTRQDIDRCHCPIGLPIGAQTPEEIAVSIGAELISARAGMGR